MRDDFSEGVKRKLAHRVGWRCSNPSCGQPTSGPSEATRGVTNVGVAAHITAASSGGTRYDASLTLEQRSAVDNGVWLCQRCAKAVDDDGVTYTRQVLLDWKVQAEARAREQIEAGSEPRLHAAVEDSAPLSIDANELLAEACRSQQGTIRQIRAWGGTIISANCRKFNKPGDARSGAKWRGALEELHRKGLIEDRGGKGIIFAVTDRGFQAADALGSE